MPLRNPADPVPAAEDPVDLRRRRAAPAQRAPRGDRAGPRRRRGDARRADEGTGRHRPAPRARRAPRGRPRLYVKKRVARGEKKTERRVTGSTSRTTALEQRLDQVERSAKLAEWRIHSEHRAHARRPASTRSRRDRRPERPAERRPPEEARPRRTHSVEMLGSAWTLCGHDHQEVAGRVGGEGEDALGLLVLAGGAQLARRSGRAGRRCRAGPRRRAP